MKRDGGWRKAARVKATAGCALLVAIMLAACVSDRSGSGPVDITSCSVQLPAEASGSTIVIIRDFAFTPAQVTVRAGSKVTWVNCGGADNSDFHTSTSDAAGWDSPLMAPGTTFTREFTSTGAFPYHCVPHPSMTGTVNVN